MGCAGVERDGAGVSREKHLEQLKGFAVLKERDAEEVAGKFGESIRAEIREFFRVAKGGDWKKVRRMYGDLGRRHRMWSGKDDRLDTVHWMTVLEVCLAYESATWGEAAHVEVFARDLLGSVSPGSVLFAGTDGGLGIATGFSRDHSRGEPFFTVTPNKLGDEMYLKYVRATYGEKLYVPTVDDSAKAFAEYMKDAVARKEAGKLKPGERVTVIDGLPSAQGYAAVMEVNGRIAKTMFDKNPERKFFIESAYGFDWMYPHLLPEGALLRINRKPLAQIPNDLVARDSEFWSERVRMFLGDWLREETSVTEVARFVRRVWAERNFAEFKGDRRFVENSWAQRFYSRWRSNVADVYAWRARKAGEEGDEGEASRMRGAADWAYWQAICLAPTNADAVYAYENLLVMEGRVEEALELAEAILAVRPKDKSYLELVGQVRELK